MFGKNWMEKEIGSLLMWCGYRSTPFFRSSVRDRIVPWLASVATS